jgi:hypothetical protein
MSVPPFVYFIINRYHTSTAIFSIKCCVSENPLNQGMMNEARKCNEKTITTNEIENE